MIVQRSAKARYTVRDTEVGEVTVQADFLAEESPERVEFLLRFFAQTQAAKNHDVRFPLVTVTEIEIHHN